MLSRNFWWILSQLPMFVAAAIANFAYRNRDFSVDRDGDWICREGDKVIVSPTAYGQRVQSILTQTREYFLPFYQPGKGDLFVDVGAGIGEETIVLADKVGAILAIEAHPVTYRCLEKSVRFSQLTNVEPLHCAVSDEPGHVRISTEDNHLANSIGAKNGVSVEALPLNSICKSRGYDRIDFLKVNIEGAERLLLKGLTGLEISNLAISCHDFLADLTGNEFFRTKEIVRQWLIENGYEIFDHQSDKPWIRDTLYARLVN